MANMVHYKQNKGIYTFVDLLHPGTECIYYSICASHDYVLSFLKILREIRKRYMFFHIRLNP